MKKLIYPFFLPLLIILLSSSFLKADILLEDFNLDDVLNNGRDLMDLGYGINYLEDKSINQNKH